MTRSQVGVACAGVQRRTRVTYARGQSIVACTRMIAVVTGSTGFIGSHLVDTLLARGATVRALVRAEGAAAGARDPRVEHCQADLLDDRSVRESRAWEGATQVFHVGRRHEAPHARAVPGRKRVPHGERARGARGARRRKPTARRARVVAGGGRPGAVRRRAGEGGRSAEADRGVRPQQAARRSRRRVATTTTLPITIVRPAAVYGPRDRDFLRVFKQAGRRVALHAVPRDHSFSIVHVADPVDALLLAAERPAAIGPNLLRRQRGPITWRGAVRRGGARRRREADSSSRSLGPAMRAGGVRATCEHA